MQTQYINFKRKRELGEIITDTFKFLRSNFKSIYKVLLKTCLIPFIIVLGAIAFYTYQTAGVNFIDQSSTLESPLLLFLSAILFFASAIYFSAMLNGSLSAFIKFYDKNDGIVAINEVVEYVKTKTGSFIGLGFLQVLYIGSLAFLSAIIFGTIIFSGSGNIGLVFLLLFLILIPTIYLSVRYSLVFPILVHSKSTVSGAFGKSAAYIKDNWWMTFFTILIMGILVAIIGGVFQFPAAIYMAIKTFTSIQEGSIGDAQSLVDPIALLLQVIGSGIQYFLYIIPAISINFIAFHLNEQKNQTGTLEQIDRLGE